ncbi:MAG: type 1 glutamine amidotransferase domain-containing protein [Roseivirga sp.]|nr:type 1 glutamine amidotransferase domain-containing protein [Roseivirga sp.]
MKHILFIVTSTSITGTGKYAAGYEFSEVADPYFEFSEQGYTVDFASILGGEPPFVGYDPLHTRSKRFKESKAFKRLSFSHALKNIDIQAYDAIYFPGGLGPMTDMVTSPLVKDVIKSVYESDRVLGAVCHGPVALLNVTLSNGKNLLEGKRITSFTEAEEKIDEHKLGEVIPFMLDAALAHQGALFSNTTPFNNYVVTDGKLITGQNPASATSVAIEMMKLI